MNKPFIFAVVMSLCALMCQPAFANPPADTITVLADGTGQTADEALKNAFKNAVYKAVGVYVLTETSSTDDNIKDKVFLNSDAVVKSHQVIKSSSRNGKYTVVIRANVMKNEIAAKIKAVEATSQISQTHVLSTVNSLDSMDEAVKAFHAVMTDFPQNVMDITTIGEPVIDESKVMNGNEVHMVQKIQISVNYKKYAQLMEKLKKIFEPFAKEKNNGVWKISFDSMGKIPENTICFLTPRISGRKYKHFNPQDFTFVAYKISRNLMQKTFFKDWHHTYVSQYCKSFSINYDLYDKDAQLIFTNIFNLGFRGKPSCGNWDSIKPFYLNGVGIVLMPLFYSEWMERFTQRGRSREIRCYGYVNRMDAALNFTIDKEDLKTVRRSSIKAVRYQRK